MSNAIEIIQKEVNKKFWFKKSSLCIKNKMDCLHVRNVG